MISAAMHYCENPVGQEVLLCLYLGKEEEYFNQILM
jgi:hypothetical protein